MDKNKLYIEKLRLYRTKINEIDGVKAESSQRKGHYEHAGGLGHGNDEPYIKERWTFTSSEKTRTWSQI